MRIGIFFPDYKPEDGGANTLLGTILKEIKDSKSYDCDFVVLYKGKSNSVVIENNIKFIDLGYLFGTKFITKAIRKIREDIFKYSILDKIAKQEKIDLYYFPEHPNINVSIPYIYTVWDLGHRTTPQYPEVSENGIWEQREALYQKMLPKALRIITGNETGKKEIVKYYGIDEKKIKVCEFPVSDFCYGKEEKPSFIYEDEFFFYPAQFWAHKNHKCIIEALKILKEEYNVAPKIYFTGSDKGYRKVVESLINQYSLNNQIVFTGFVKDEELKYMYTHATALVYASMMGPNNMPPIEATYLGCPVIITNLEGHIEQLKDTAIYFDGNNPRELAEKMLLLLNDKKYRDQVIDKEQTLGDRFSKISYFEQIENIFDEVKMVI